MDFVARGARDQRCAHEADHHAIECGKLTARAGTPVASLFGATDRSADTVWDHDPVQHSSLVLH